MTYQERIAWSRAGRTGGGEAKKKPRRTGAYNREPLWTAGSELEHGPETEVLVVGLAGVGDVLVDGKADLGDVVGEVGDVVVIAELLGFGTEEEPTAFEMEEGSGTDFSRATFQYCCPALA